MYLYIPNLFTVKNKWVLMQKSIFILQEIQKWKSGDFTFEYLMSIKCDYKHILIAK